METRVGTELSISERDERWERNGMSDGSTQETGWNGQRQTLGVRSESAE